MKTQRVRLVASALVCSMILGLAPEASAGGKKGNPGGPKPPSAPHMSLPQPRVVHPNVNRQAQMMNQQAMQQRAMQQMAMQQRARQQQTRVKTNPQRQVMPRQYVGRNNLQPRRGRTYAYRPGVRRNRGTSYPNRYASNNRTIRTLVSQLRSTHSLLARLDHDYQGHRIKAMRSINQAMRQLTHTSQRRSGGMRSAMRVQGNRANLAGNNRSRQPIPQARSDQQMRKAMQTLGMINQQLTAQGSTTSHARARGSVQLAIREINTALSIR